ncbi:hypothetical protein PSACC_02246 [Paramicrosporidium saccamoebae]|uniref:Uncharacterized protein n=1 Tax=Paramicrosporidium saccamoebae TaxID=1246581 RepID=A0A2H9TJM7_9FUNG|nr:hypothetical protein PSACC_02246 [Paramicrosporidium saccamoebae]
MVPSKEQLDTQFVGIPGIALSGDPGLEADLLVNDALEKVAEDVTEKIREMEPVMGSEEEKTEVKVPEEVLNDAKEEPEKIRSAAKETTDSVQPVQLVKENTTDNEENAQTSQDKSEEVVAKDTQEVDSEHQVIAGSIEEHIAKKIEDELAPEEPIALVEKQEEEPAPSASGETMLTGISTTVISTSGTTTTSIATVTFDPSFTRIRRCIYGCRTLTVESGSAKAGLAVVALPVTLPCSLVNCPPCGCTTSFVHIIGCPIIQTVTPPDSYVTVTNDATITYITVTTTISSCTATTCLTPITVTVTTGPSGITTITQYSTFDLATTIIQFSTERAYCTPTPIIPDCQCPAGYDWDGQSDPPPDPCAGSIIPPDCPCQPQQEEEDCGCDQEGDCDDCDDEHPQGVVLVPVQGGCPGGHCPWYNFKAEAGKDDKKISDSKDANNAVNAKDGKGTVGSKEGQVDAKEKKAVGADGRMSADGKRVKKKCKKCHPNKPKKGCRPAPMGGACPTGNHPARTGATSTITGSICTTFVVCNPSQFNCPAQITGGAQLPAFMESWGLAPNKIPGGFPYAYLAGGMPQPGMEYLGYDGNMHGIGAGYAPLRNATEPTSISTTASASTTTKKKDVRMEAASKNSAITLAGSTILSMVIAVWVVLSSWV